jgi:sortase A
MTLLDEAASAALPRAAMPDAPVARSTAPRRAPRSRRAVTHPVPAARAIGSWALMLTALLALWVVVYSLFLSGLQEARTQKVLYAQFREQLAGATAPLNQPIRPGVPVALIEGAGLGSLVVVEGTTSQNLEAGPGHLRSTPFPGQPGVSVIYGRAATFGGPFGAISSMRQGQKLTAVTAQGTFTYEVLEVRRPGELAPPVMKPGQGRMILASAQASGWQSGWASNTAVYVYTQLVDAPQTDPGGRFASVPSDEKLLQGQSDTVTLLSVVLWLQLLVVAAVAFVWLNARWFRCSAWLVCTPVLALALWGASAAVVRLLPNVL